MKILSSLFVGLAVYGGSILSVAATGDRAMARRALKGIEFKYDTITGIGHEPGCTRRDPSDLIRVGDNWYVWYTKVYGRSPGYWGTVWYAVSTDEGYSWTEMGEALGVGRQGHFDAQAVFTPNIIAAHGKYYLYYTGVQPTPGRTDGVFENNNTTDYTAIGVAVADTPEGPFRRVSEEPVLAVSADAGKFDSYRVDDAALNFRDGKYWLYYKGRSLSDGPEGPRHTMMGVAFSDDPAGPFERYTGNPILDKSHEVLIWRQNGGIACLASISCTLEYAADGLDFMGDPLNIAVERKQRPNAPGAVRMDLTDAGTAEDGLHWGISMVHNGSESYLIRWHVE
jgi:beta-xylosidase